MPVLLILTFVVIRYYFSVRIGKKIFLHKNITYFIYLSLYNILNYSMYEYLSYKGLRKRKKKCINLIREKRINRRKWKRMPKLRDWQYITFNPAIGGGAGNEKDSKEEGTLASGEERRDISVVADSIRLAGLSESMRTRVHVCPPTYLSTCILVCLPASQPPL